MSDVMRIQPFATQLRRVVAEYGRNRSVFDIPDVLFHRPEPGAPYAVRDMFGRFLASPIGPSAGPHTQLSQNIVSAFVCGARFFELKTVQANDTLVIPRPCIDMTDEGYNVEWSQELSLDDSAHEYVVAWALVHLLPRLLGWDEPATEGGSLPGVVFDMSVGYDLAGITGPSMTRFMDRMADASGALATIQQVIAREFPQFADVAIPTRIVNSVTLSTMHGCPPNEIERIARYLIEDRHLHTVVKLNPTLLGREHVLDILHGSLGLDEIEIPGRVFDSDLQYAQAVELITTLQRVAAAAGVTFGVKLSNTLAVANHARRLPGDEMYMSGRALYPVTMNLFARLLDQFKGDLRVSYSAGVDALNVATVLSCGALPVTGCSDLLKPGGYGRLGHWLSTLRDAMATCGACDLDTFAADRLANVRQAAARALTDPRFKKRAHPPAQPKVLSSLGLWDCIAAPCVEMCAVEQAVPDYAWFIAQGDETRVLATILSRNPLPGVTGHVCTKLCETRCTRSDYDETVAIRALKRFAQEHGHAPLASHAKAPTGRRVAIIGSGPSGLAAAAFLAINGVAVTLFEAKDVAGGMLRAVPPFRLPATVIQRDIEGIEALGVEIKLVSPITVPPERLLDQGFDAVYLAAGFQWHTPLRVPGVEGPGVMPALELLEAARRTTPVAIGPIVVVIGGGDTAMDAARTAHRITGQPATILYRRSLRELPAAPEEVDDTLHEGNLLRELVAPVEVLREAGRVIGIRCVRTQLGHPGPDGRRTPVEIPGSELVMPCDTVVVAIGQLPALTFLEGSSVARHSGGGVIVDAETRQAGCPGVYAGGDVVIEPASIISACDDGRRAAESICRQLGVSFDPPPSPHVALSANDIAEVKTARTRKVPQMKPATVPASRRTDFGLIESTLTPDEARAEARRCVQCAALCDKCVEVCPNRANYTFMMAPVRWRLPVLAAAGGKTSVEAHETFRIDQSRQILHVDDFCNECDNCQTFCVHKGRPYQDKPRLFLDAETFAREQQNAFMIDGRTIRRREQGEEHILTVAPDGFVYETPSVRVRATSDWQILDVRVHASFEGRCSLRPAAEMAALYDGITRTLPFLLLK